VSGPEYLPLINAVGVIVLAAIRMWLSYRRHHDAAALAAHRDHAPPSAAPVRTPDG
jgi:hypothetical protein